MKQVVAVFAFAAVLSEACTKQTVCAGSDCILPEAAVAVDSIVQDAYFVTLLNSADQSLVCVLHVSPLIDEKALQAYVESCSVKDCPPGQINDPRPVKVYYSAVDQSYVTENAAFINAGSTALEIVGFGDDLILTY